MCEKSITARNVHNFCKNKLLLYLFTLGRITLLRNNPSLCKKFAFLFSHARSGHCVTDYQFHSNWRSIDQIGVKSVLITIAIKAELIKFIIKIIKLIQLKVAVKRRLKVKSE